MSRPDPFSRSLSALVFDAEQLPLQFGMLSPEARAGLLAVGCDPDASSAWFKASSAAAREAGVRNRQASNIKDLFRDDLKKLGQTGFVWIQTARRLVRSAYGKCVDPDEAKNEAARAGLEALRTALRATHPRPPLVIDDLKRATALLPHAKALAPHLRLELPWHEEHESSILARYAPDWAALGSAPLLDHLLAATAAVEASEKRHSETSKAATAWRDTLRSRLAQLAADWKNAGLVAGHEVAPLILQYTKDAAPKRRKKREEQG
jgi:hypothetical protein